MFWPLALNTGMFLFENPIEFKVESLIVTEYNCTVVGQAIADNSPVKLNAEKNCTDDYKIGRIHRVIWAEAKLPLGCETHHRKCSETTGKVGIGITIKAKKSCMQLAKSQADRDQCATRAREKAEGALNQFVSQNLKSIDKPTRKALKKSQAIFFEALKADVALLNSANTLKAIPPDTIETREKTKAARLLKRLHLLQQWLNQDQPNSELPTNGD